MKKTFTGHTKCFLGISGLIIVVALIMQICGAGINLGIDFKGGSLLNYSVGEEYDDADVTKVLKAAGYEDGQVTKTAPSEASIAIREELAKEAEEAAKAAEEAEEPAEETAEETAEEPAEETAEEPAEETAEETAEEPAEEPAEETAEEPAEEAYVSKILDPDKSGIKADGLTDLQIRLDLEDKTANLENDLNSAVKGILEEAEPTGYGYVTNIIVNQMNYDQVYAGGYQATFEIGREFDTEGIADQVTAALTELGYSVESVTAMRYDPAVEQAMLEAENAEPEYEDIEEIATEDAEAEDTEAADTEAEDTEAEDTEAEDTEAEDTEAEDTEAEDGEEEESEEVIPETGTSLRILVSVEDETSQVRDMLEKELGSKYPDFVFVSIDHVSAVAGKGLISNAVKALLIAFAAMLVYIALRFDFYSGVVALGALVHDVLIMCAFMVFFRGLFQANSPFIAAILTIVGYSINNTIIIFDRIRENAKKPGQTMMKRIDIVEMSVQQTLSRTVNTTITTMITLVCLFIFGVDSIKEFAFPLIVGMLAGTWSSLMLSGQVWGSWVDKMNARKAAKKA